MFFKYFPYKDYIIINGIKISIDFFRNSLPYIIEYNIDTKDYFIMNREYEYINYSVKINPLKWEKSKRIYLYNDITKPWEELEYFINYINNYKSHTENLNQIVNDNKFIDLLPYFN